MKKKWLVVACAVLLLAILATIAFAGNPVNLFVNCREGDIKGENEQAEVVKLVEDFGQKLKSVSLLAPQEVLNQSLQENYGGLVAPALLAEWQEEDPQNIPGRVPSSPWPERIEVLNVEKLAGSGYRIKGEIIEVTSVELAEGGAAARRPITLDVDKIEGSWLITAVQLGPYEEAGSH